MCIRLDVSLRDLKSCTSLNSDTMIQLSRYYPQIYEKMLSTRSSNETSSSISLLRNQSTGKTTTTSGFVSFRLAIHQSAHKLCLGCGCNGGCNRHSALARHGTATVQQLYAEVSLLHFRLRLLPAVYILDRQQTGRRRSEPSNTLILASAAAEVAS